MSDPARTMHLNAAIVGLGQFAGAWRLPEADPSRFVSLAHFQELAQLAERGTFDAVFLPDVPAVDGDVRFAPAHALDPLVLLAGVAAVTERVGLVATASTTYNHPYTVARQLASLDHVSGGRAGWNVVATARPAVAANHGDDELPGHAERYARAAEFVDVARLLWDSWDEAAYRGDKESGEFADPELIAPIAHRGERFAVEGPLNVPRPPQGHPVLLQAGASETGLDFAARYAEAVFTILHTTEDGQRAAADLRARVQTAGRPVDAVRIFPGLLPVVGATEAEAQARRAELEALVPLEYGRKRLALRLGVEPEVLDLDRPIPLELLPDESDVNGSRGFFKTISEFARREQLTVRDTIRRLGGGRGHTVVAGAPEQIADRMQEVFESGAADGFVVFADVLPSGLEAFVDHVVPELRRRGLFREQYEGKTLRDHYGLAKPASARSASPRAAGDGARPGAEQTTVPTTATVA